MKSARSATVTATSPLRSHRLPVWSFRSFARRARPSVTWKLLELLAERLRAPSTARSSAVDAASDAEPSPAAARGRRPHGRRSSTARALCARDRPRVYRLEPADAEDVFQEVFTRVFERLDASATAPRSARGSRRPPGTARSTHSAGRAARQRWTSCPEDADDTLERLDEALTVYAALDRLSPDCHEILDRFFCRDESYRHDRRGARTRPGRSRAGSPAASRACGTSSTPRRTRRRRREEKRGAARRVERWEGHDDARGANRRAAASLPAPPRGWVEAAKERCPRHVAGSRRSSSASNGTSAYQLVVADLESMLLAEGIEPTPVVVAHLRRSLAS